MTDLDGELERLRAEARERLKGEQELADQRAAYEKIERELREPPKSVAKDEESDDEESAPVASSSLSAKAAEHAAQETAKKVSALSTPKLLVLLVVLAFGAIIVQRIIGPLVTLACLAILLLLAYRGFRWFVGGSDAEPDGED